MRSGAEISGIVCHGALGGVPAPGHPATTVAARYGARAARKDNRKASKVPEAIAERMSAMSFW